MGEEIIDLDAMRPKEQIIIIAGKKFNTSKISFGVTLELIDKMEEVDTKQGKTTKKMLTVFGDIVDVILKEANNEIDDKWLKENVGSYEKLILIEKVVTPLMEETTDSVTAKAKKKQSLT